jgi:hypothetical protein
VVANEGGHLTCLGNSCCQAQTSTTADRATKTSPG